MHESYGEEGFRSRRIIGLAQLCQRVLIANIDSIAGFGPDMPHRLVKPVLQGCNADTLLRLEQETPHLVEHNEELWKDLCFRSYPVAAEQYTDGDCEEPESWREEFFYLREEEERRLEQASNKIRNQRQEAEELKRKRQVKLAHRLPPPKRTRRGWSTGPAPPKTLFEKTRREATKIQQSVFGPRTLPPIVRKSYNVNAGAPSAQLSPSKSSTPVTINAVTVRSSQTPSRPATLQSKGQPEQPVRPLATSVCQSRPPISSPTEVRTLERSPRIPKKNSMAALFLPKRRAALPLPNLAPSSHSTSPP